MSTRDSPGGKGGRCMRLTTYHPCSAESQEIRALTYPDPLGPSRRPVLGENFTFTCMFTISASTIAWHISGTVSLIVCLQIWKIHCKRVYESPVAKNRNVTVNLSWTGIAAGNLVCLFTILGPTKLISISKSSGTIRVNFLYRPRISSHFISAYKWVPLYTDLFLYNSVCHQRLSCRFLLLDMRCTYTKAALPTCKDIFPPGAANTGG